MIKSICRMFAVTLLSAYKAANVMAFNFCMVPLYILLLYKPDFLYRKLLMSFFVSVDCQDKWMMHGSDVDCKAKNGVTIR